MKKILSLLLVALMIVGMLPMMPITANAADGSYELVTDVSQLSVGDKVVIAAKGSNFALSTTQNSNNRGQASITKSGNTITFGDDVQVLTLAAGKKDGTFAFDTGSGYLYAASSKSNHLKTQTTLNENGSWTIAVTSSGVATIKASGSNSRNWMRYNSSNNPPIFSAYSSGQADICLYVLKESSGGETVCEHTNTVAIGEPKPATCTETGMTAGVKCADCGKTVTAQETIPALGHDFSNGESCANCGEKVTVVAYKITTAEEFVTGEYVVVANNGYALGQWVDDGPWVTAVQPKFSGDYVVEETSQWTLNVNGSNVTMTDSNGVTVIYKSSTDNGISKTNGTWVWSVDADGNFTFADANPAKVKLASNTQSSNKFRAYKVSTINGNQAGYPCQFTLYKVGTPCTHTNIVAVGEAKDATCDVDGWTAGEKCADCGKVIKAQEEIAALGHSFDENDVCTNCGAPRCSHANQNTVTTDATCAKPGSIVVTCVDCGKTISEEEILATGEHNYVSVVNPEATCTTDGLKTDTCSVCGNIKTEIIPAIGHNYVDGICANCSEPKPASLAGRYYIATIRSSGNYFYMTSDLGTASTKRYQAVDSGSTTLPETITASENDNKVFVLVENADGTYCIYAEGVAGDNYLGYGAENSGILVAEADALKLKIDKLESGLVNIHFTGDAERYLSLNGTSGNNYFAFYKGTQKQDLSLIPVVEGGSETPDEPETPVDPPATETPDTPTEAPAVTSATITFDDKTKRTEYSTTQQVWTENDITVTNNKAESTTNVGDYAKPARFYKNSELIIAYEGMVKIVLTGVGTDSDKYFTPLTGSLDAAGVSYTVDGYDVTIEFAEPVDSFDFVCSAGQVRLNAVTVYAVPSGCTHNWSEWEGTDATCTEDGTKTRQCSLCQKTETQNIKATGHSYSYSEGVLSCVNGDVTIEKSTIAVAKAYTDDTQLYLIEGVVTFVDGQKVFIQDETAGICVYFTNAAAAEGIAVGDKIAVWDTMTTYKGLIETTYTTKDEYTKISEGNTVAAKEATIADLGAYLCEKVTLNNLTVSAVGVEDGEATYTVSDGTNKIDIYGVKIGESDPVAVGSIINVEAVVSIFNNYQLVTSKEQIKVLMGVQKWNITLGDDISVNFNIHVADDIAATTQVKVTFNGETDAYMASELEGAIKVNVAAAQMGDKITVEIGQEFKKEYSVKAYADYILEEKNGFDAKTKALVTEMLAYGAAAQTYFGYNQNNLVFTGTAGTAEPTTAKEMDVSGTAEGVRFYGASLVFENKIAIRYYFVVDEGVELSVECAGDYKMGKANELTYIEIADILPQDLGGDYSITVNGVAVTYSPMNYIVRMYEKGGAVAPLVQALYNYHLAAVAYAKPAAQ